MNKIRTFAFGFAIAATATFTVIPVAAQQQQQQQGPDDDEGPGRGVARISLMNGDVSVKRGDTGDLVAATINSPLMVSDRVLTGPGSRAELQFDSSNLLRMSEVSEVRMSELEFQKYMIQIAAGSVTFRVIRDQSSQIELNTPSVALRPIKRGEYRITVREDGTTEITVRSGELEIFTQRGTERLKSGRTMLARGTSADPEFQIVAAAARDDFDRWNQDRDRYFERSQSYSNMSQDIYGGEDLDDNGTWVNNAQYGRVWVPRVNAGWAPYQDGRWVYYDWYGWTWVSNDPWGWAPYHYGRWFYDASIGWGWWPGGLGRRHYWRPAFVSFFGWGGNGGFRAGIGFGFGNVGWVPLAPFEPCYGWWGRNRYNGWRNNGFYNNTTIINNVNITNIYRNARVTNGITSVGSNDFGRNRVHAGNIVRTRVDDLRGAGVVRGNLPVVPDRQASVRLTDREPRNSGYARTSDNQRGFRTREPARVERVSFEDQRRGTEDLARRSFDRGDRGGERVRGGAPETERVRGGADGNNNTNNGWRRAGGGAGSPEGRTVEPGAQPNREAGRTNENGWRRFGDAGRADTEGGRGRNSVDGDSGGGRVRNGIDGADPGRTDRNGGRSRSEDGWRRFGDSNRGNGDGLDGGNGSNGRVRNGIDGVEPGRSGNSGRNSSEDSWRRFGDSNRGNVDNGGGGGRMRNGSEGFDPNSGRVSPDRSGGGRVREPRGSDGGGVFRNRDNAPSSYPDVFRGSRDRSGGDMPRVQRQERSPEPVRISPPIVRERGYDGGGFGGGGGMRGGGGSAGPARESAPPMDRGNRGGDGGSRGGGGEGGGRRGGRGN
jgi:hypothetical protein